MGFKWLLEGPDAALFAQPSSRDSLTLAGIPAETFEYRLGSRSALEWVIDQYQIKRESDPNREDDPGYIVRLVGQVVRVSMDTVRLVSSFPNYR